MRQYYPLVLALIWFRSLVPAEAVEATTREQPPIPVLSFDDVTALYTAKDRPSADHFPGDWNYPKLKSYPHQKELIDRCLQDWTATMKVNPNPFHMMRNLKSGRLVFGSINKDPKNRIVYFNFGFESELVYDFFVVYYYDPHQDRLILKTNRILSVFVKWILLSSCFTKIPIHHAKIWQKC